jgi:hypothetical protein
MVTHGFLCILLSIALGSDSYSLSQDQAEKENGVKWNMLLLVGYWNRKRPSVEKNQWDINKIWSLVNNNAQTNVGFLALTNAPQ